MSSPSGPLVQTPSSAAAGFSAMSFAIGSRSIAGHSPRECPRNPRMRITLVRSATVIVEIAGKRILVDPMLDDMGARPPIEGTRNQVANPTVPLPFPAEDVVRGLDCVIVTHRHRDHLDTKGEELLPRDVPVFCQPEDRDALRDLGLDVRPVDASTQWEGLTI